MRLPCNYPLVGTRPDESNPYAGFWMSDKPIVQQALATEIADILLAITSVSVSLAFLRGFWETTVKEWSSIDRLR